MINYKAHGRSAVPRVTKRNQPLPPPTKANFVEGRMRKNLPRVAHSCYQSPNGGLPQSVYKYPSTSSHQTFSLGRSFPFDWGYCFSSCQTLTLTLIFLIFISTAIIKFGGNIVWFFTKPNVKP